MKRPKRVDRCTTHHHACDCHQWRYEQLESALKIIWTWANTLADEPGKYEPVEKTLTDIAMKADEALSCLDV